jgi:hypothetical protein
MQRFVGATFALWNGCHENCSEGCSEYAVERAAGNGDLLMLQWLHQHYSDRFTVRK